MVQGTCYRIRPLNCAVLSISGRKKFLAYLGILKVLLCLRFLLFCCSLLPPGEFLAPLKLVEVLWWTVASETVIYPSALWFAMNHRDSSVLLDALF